MKQFTLAGLLRLRKTQEDAAAGDLARANRRLRENEQIDRHARLALASYGDEATSTEQLRAIAASRLATSVTLAELRITRDALDQERGEAQQTYTIARTRSVTLEKLEERHRERMFAEELRAEQNALDELANTRRPENGDHA